MMQKTNSKHNNKILT